jgi:DNA mismatch repair protein MutS2
VQPLVAALRTLPELERRLHFCLEEGGRVADRASPPLERLRHQLRSAREERRARLQESMRRYASLLQDTVIAERNGRPVLAVKAAAAGQVPGLVHDSSASGLTVLVEPQAVISQGNRIRDLEGQERELERAVLREPERPGGEEAESLIHLQAVMVALDGALARARYGQWLGAVRPVLEADPLAPFELRDLRHPLLLWQERRGGGGPGGAGERLGEHGAAGGGDHRPQHRRQDRDPQKRGPGGPDGPGRLVSPLRGHPSAALVRPGAGRHRR